MDLKERPDQGVHRHPWEAARFRFFRNVLHRAGLLDRASRVLDVGAGDAWFSKELLSTMAAGSRVTAWDTGYTPELESELRAQRDVGIELVAERPDGARDLVLMLDVLEHVEDDAGFLAETVERNLESGGMALISVPAWQFLFSSHDAALGHHRRYSPRSATSLVEGSGLVIVRRGGLFHSLAPIRALSTLRETLRPPPVREAPSLAWTHGPALTSAVDAWLAADNLFSSLSSRAGLNVPGLSWWALCRKP